MNTLRYRPGLKTIFLSLSGAALSLMLVFFMKNYQPQSRVVSAIPIRVEDPTSAIILPQETTSSQISSDATRKLIMKVTNNQNGSKTYDFFASDGSRTNEQAVFSKTLDAAKSMTIPFNTWSPDNAYFFIQEDGGEDGVMVFNASSEPFATDSAYLDVTGLYKQRGYKDKFSEATGWASPELIVINTTTEENTKGSSYWFEVPSRAIIQLGLQF